MAEVIKLVQGDTAPHLKLTLVDDVTQTPVNLTGATVTLHVRAAGSSVLAFSRPAIIESPATNGIATIRWQIGDLDRAPGNYEAEVEIVSSDGTRETIYDLISLIIREDIG